MRYGRVSGMAGLSGSGHILGLHLPAAGGQKPEAARGLPAASGQLAALAGPAERKGGQPRPALAPLFPAAEVEGAGGSAGRGAEGGQADAGLSLRTAAALPGGLHRFISK